MSAFGLLNGRLSLKKSIFSGSIKCNFYWISFCWFVFISFQWKQRAHTCKNTSESRRSVQEIPAVLVKSGTGGRRGAHTQHLCWRMSYSINSRNTWLFWVCPTIHEHTNTSGCQLARAQVWWCGLFTRWFRWTLKHWVGKVKTLANVRGEEPEVGASRQHWCRNPYEIWSLQLQCHSITCFYSFLKHCANIKAVYKFMHLYSQLKQRTMWTHTESPT